jgi:hypothetical protein
MFGVRLHCIFASIALPDPVSAQSHAAGRGPWRVIATNFHRFSVSHALRPACLPGLWACELTAIGLDEWLAVRIHWLTHLGGNSSASCLPAHEQLDSRAASLNFDIYLSRAARGGA